MKAKASTGGEKGRHLCNHGLSREMENKSDGYKIKAGKIIRTRIHYLCAETTLLSCVVVVNDKKNIRYLSVLIRRLHLTRKNAVSVEVQDQRRADRCPAQIGGLCHAHGGGCLRHAAYAGGGNEA